MKMKEKLKYKDECREIFMDYLSEEIPFITYDGKEAIAFDPDENWIQCYSPSTTARSQITPHWFLSDKGDLCGVRNDNVYLIRKQVDKEGYIYHVMQYVNEQGAIANKKIRLHVLMALVWGGRVYGRKAKQRLEEKGLFAFGTAPHELNCHHIDGDKTNNDPSNLCIMTAKMHRMIDLSFPDGAKPEKMDDYMAKLAVEVAQESPYGITLVESGQHRSKDDGQFKYDTGKRDIRSMRNIVFTDVGLADMFGMLAQCRADLGENF